VSQPTRLLSKMKIKKAVSNRRTWLEVLSFGVAGIFLAKNTSPGVAGQTAKKIATAEKSVQLHIYIEVKPGKGPALEELYQSAYVPAIQIQDGFLWSRLLRHYDSDRQYEIDISFKTEKQRAAWAQSKQHQSAWPKMEAVGEKITWQGLDVLA
jgi:heme-degrading monooxygenase HmoA